MDDEHRDLRAVLRGIPDLLDLVGGAVHLGVHVRELARLARLEVVAEGSRRIGEGCEVEEHLRVVGLARDGRDRAQRGQLDLLHFPAVEPVEGEAVAGILEALDHDLLVDHAGRVELLLRLRHHGHRRARAVGHVHGDHAAQRRVLVRDEEQTARGIPRIEVGVGEALEQELGLAVPAAVGHPDLRLVAGPLEAGQDQPAAVEAQARAPDHLLAVGGLEDERVLVLSLAHPVEVDLREIVLLARGHRARLREARVVEAAVLGGPGDARELGPLDLVRQVLARGHVADVDLLAVGAAAGEAVAQERAVPGGRGGDQGHRPVGAQGVSVEQDALGARQALAHAEHGLVLQPGVAREEVAVALLLGHGHARIVDERGQARLDGLPRGRVEVGARERVLGLHPSHRLGIVGRLEPTVGIGDLDAVVVLHHVRLLGRRIGQARGPGRRHHGGGEGGGERGGDGEGAEGDPLHSTSWTEGAPYPAGRPEGGAPIIHSVAGRARPAIRSRRAG